MRRLSGHGRLNTWHKIRREVQVNYKGSNTYHKIDEVQVDRGGLDT